MLRKHPVYKLQSAKVRVINRFIAEQVEGRLERNYKTQRATPPPDNPILFKLIYLEIM